MRHPRDYAVNEAWIVFCLNETPVETELDGAADIVCLMDAASCYVLGHELVSAESAEVPAPAAARLLETGRAAANGLPGKLLLSSGLGTAQFAGLAAEAGIDVERVPDKDLAAFLSQVRQGFRRQRPRQS